MAEDLKARGQQIISLGLGEPDFDTPANIIDAGVRAMHQGHTRYTAVPGILPLREAICRKLKEENGLEYAPEQIIVGTGAKQVIYNAMVATLDPGDEVIIPTPCWVSYPDMVSLAGGRPVFVTCRRENSYLPDPDELAAQIGPRTKWLMLNSPCNPTGAVLQHRDLCALAEVLRRHPHVSVLSDEVYEKIVYPGTTVSTLASAAPDLGHRCLLVNSFSKTYCMTGWRVGYGAGPGELVKAMNLVQSQTTSHAASISQAAAVEALQGPQDYLDEFRDAFHRRLRFTLEAVNAIPGITCMMPQGSFYLFPDCSEMMGLSSPGGDPITSDVALGMYFMEAAGVAVVPGTAFLCENHFRISCATSMENLATAVEQLKTACTRLK